MSVLVSCPQNSPPNLSFLPFCHECITPCAPESSANFLWNSGTLIRDNQFGRPVVFAPVMAERSPCCFRRRHSLQVVNRLQMCSPAVGVQQVPYSTKEHTSHYVRAGCVAAIAGPLAVREKSCMSNTGRASELTSSPSRMWFAGVVCSVRTTVLSRSRRSETLSSASEGKLGSFKNTSYFLVD